MPPRISKDDFDNWKHGPVGKEFFNLLRENLDKLAYNNMTNSFARDQIGNAQEIGKFEATMFYFKMTYEELMGEE